MNQVDTTRLRMLMAAKRLNNAALARKAGVSTATIFGLMGAKHEPTYGLICKVIRALEIPAEDVGGLFFKAFG